MALSLVHELIHKLIANLEEEQPVNVANTLYELALKKIWSSEDVASIDFLAKRIEISRKLFVDYDVEGRTASDQLLTEPWLGLAVLVFYKAFLLDRSKQAPRGALYKRINTLLKCMELTKSDWLSDGSALRSEIEDALIALGETRKDDGCEVEVTGPPPPLIKHCGLEMLPLTVLFYEGPIVRAYLETLYSMGYKPERIIQLVSSRDVANKRPVGRFLPGALRIGYAENIQKRKIHYWPKQISRLHPELHKAITEEVVSSFKFDPTSLDSATSLKHLSQYSDDVVSLLVEGLGDSQLFNYLEACPETAVLFTGGGIVPPKLLGIPQLRFIHFHPGFLPDIRGADCVLWSSLLVGRTSATCFYMSPGIDTGDIVKSCWLPKVRFGLQENRYDAKILYRAIYSFFDPWVRAYVLREVLQSHSSLTNIRTYPQSEGEGLTYHFMHSKILAIAFQQLLSCED